MGGSDGYGGTFTGTSGTLYLASTDQLTTNVTVGSTSTFGGNGTITGNTTVLSGGTLAPATAVNNVATGAGTLTINGNLTFNSGSTYGVQVGSTASKTQVSGTATLGNATVAPTVVAGTTVQSKYTILTANSIAGTFGVVSNAAAPGLSGTVSYDTKNAYLNLTFNPAANGVATGNQSAVGNAINTTFQATGGLPAAYASLSGLSLSQAAGELGTASHAAAFGTMDAFVGSFTGGLSDPGALDGRGASGMISYYTDAKPKIQKTAAAEAIDQHLFKPYWTVWTQTFGGTEHIGGNGVSGASASDTQNIGQLIAAEYRLAKDTSVGAAVAGGGQWFSLANGMGSGKAGFGQLALFGTHTFDNLYVSGTLAGGFDSMTTDRTVVGPLGANSLHGSFTGTVLSARGEIGNRFKTDFATITPYAALQGTALYLPNYTETSTSGGGSLYALNYASKTVGDTKSELGAKVSRTFALSDAQTLTLSSRLAWQHDFNPNQTAQATFIDLPGSTFTVAGAKPAANAALVNTAARVDIGNGVSLEAGFDGTFASNVQVYAGHGRVSYRW
jgi:outer membrane autotransporter protein